MNETLIQAAAIIVPLVFAIVFHEVAHGLVARLLGDPTAAELNRLSLNPLRHVDPVGTVILPGLLALMKAPVFGWAKPVPVNKWRLRNPRVGMMLVAAAGPGMNFAMAAVAAVVLGLLLKPLAGAQPSAESASFVIMSTMYFLQFNIFLALFNLLPIPPFDGSHIVEGLLPRELAAKYAQLGRYGMVLVILLLVVLPWAVPSLNIVGGLIGPPFEWVFRQYLDLTGAIARG